MNQRFYRIKDFVKQNFFFYLLGFVVILGIKYFYCKAGSDALIWILAPTTKWVSILSGIPFSYESGLGYVNHNLRYVIAPSCSGVQFMLILMATLMFSFVHRTGNGRFLWTLGSIMVSYPLTVFINGLRIIMAIYLPLFLEGSNFHSVLLTPDRLHTLIGTVVYFVSLLTIHRLVDVVFLRISESAANAQTSIIPKFLAPLFWYFFIVLGIPFLNSAVQKRPEQFFEYALLIISACGLIIGVYSCVSLIKKLGSSRAL